MPKFPSDAPIRKMIGALEKLGFRLIREENHIGIMPWHSLGEGESVWTKNCF
jgi:hypothetical protein